MNTIAGIASRTNRLALDAVEAAHGTQDVSSHVAQVPAPADETGAGAHQLTMAADALATQSVAVQREVAAFPSAIRAACMPFAASGVVTKPGAARGAGSG